MTPPAIDAPALSQAFFTLCGRLVGGIVDMLEPMLGRRAGSGDLEPFTRQLIAAAREPAAQALDVSGVFERVAQLYLASLAPFDVLLTPTYATPPWELGWLSPLLPRAELLARMDQAVCYTPVQNISGATAMSVPLYWTPDGVPIGCHFAAAPGREDVLLQLAYELEQARPWADRWAPHSFVSVAAA